MADEDLEMEAGEETEGEEGGEKKKSSMKLIIIAVVGLVVLGAGGFFGWKFFFAAPDKPKDQAAVEEQKAKEGEGKEAAATKPGTVLNLQPFIVNLADPSGKRYLKLSLAVDAKDEKLKAELEARMPMIRDSILLLLTSKSYSDISTVAGKIRLRNEILKIINKALVGVGGVHAVYFTEFVVQ